tara:strand:- start:187 stop:438 length:252 start_codon:yes stop_codon:yes gene_type:complete
MFAAIGIHNRAIRLISQRFKTNAALVHKVIQFASHVIGSIIAKKYDVIGLPEAQIVYLGAHKLLFFFCRVLTISEEYAEIASE